MNTDYYYMTDGLTSIKIPSDMDLRTIKRRYGNRHLYKVVCTNTDCWTQEWIPETQQWDERQW